MGLLLRILRCCDDLILGLSGIVNNNGKDMRRESTILRNNEVHDLYSSIVSRLGDLAGVVSRSYIYEEIRLKTRLSIRQIQRILNHTKRVDLS